MPDGPLWRPSARAMFHCLGAPRACRYRKEHMMSPEQINDVLDCGNPEQVWTVTIAYLESRARQAADIGESLRRDAQDALEQADGHLAAAQEFHNLALAMKRAPVTFAASVDTHPKGGDVEQAPAPLSGAVPNGETPQGDHP